MFKRGETRVPLDKIPAMAKALDVDPALLFRFAIEQYWPDQERVIASIFGQVVSRNEVRIIELIRRITNDSDPELTPELEEKIRAIFE